MKIKEFFKDGDRIVLSLYQINDYESSVIYSPLFDVPCHLVVSPCCFLICFHKSCQARFMHMNWKVSSKHFAVFLEPHILKDVPSQTKRNGLGGHNKNNFCCLMRAGGSNGLKTRSSKSNILSWIILGLWRGLENQNVMGKAHLELRWRLTCKHQGT
jgi:hypothetical protein